MRGMAGPARSRQHHTRAARGGPRIAGQGGAETRQAGVTAGESRRRRGPARREAIAAASGGWWVLTARRGTAAMGRWTSPASRLPASERPKRTRQEASRGVGGIVPPTGIGVRAIVCRKREKSGRIGIAPRPSIARWLVGLLFSHASPGVFAHLCCHGTEPLARHIRNGLGKENVTRACQICRRLGAGNGRAPQPNRGLSAAPSCAHAPCPASGALPCCCSGGSGSASGGAGALMAAARGAAWPPQCWSTQGCASSCAAVARVAGSRCSSADRKATASGERCGG